MKIFKLKIMLLAGVLFSSTAIGQTKKVEKSYSTKADVTVEIDATHANLEVEQWDKNEVLIEAFLEMPDASEAARKKALADWKLDLSGDANKVSVRSVGGFVGPDIDMASLQEPLSKLPELMAPLQNMIGPLLEGISGNPLPPEFYESMGDVNFDYEAYQKEGDKYLEKFEKKMEKNFGEDFEKAMEKWAAKFEKDSALWAKQTIIMEDMGAQFEKDMEAWGEEFGKNMEAWGEQFGKDMEAWAENLEKQVEAEYGDTENKVIVINRGGSKSKKTIRIKMPKQGQVKLDVRHGNVKLGGTVMNLQGGISHGRFTANQVSGKQTDFKVAYTPVKVNQWKYGMLKASYVKDLEINKVGSIKLTSNSSDVKISEINKEGILRGSFGDLVIEKVGNGFSSLDIVLENSDLSLDLPDVAYNFQYSGNNSKVDYPKELTVNSSKSYDQQKLTGYHKKNSANASISISASFSDLLLK